jgi:acetamidase/formamidase
MSRHYVIEPTPENMVLGYFDAARPPILKVESGDVVTLTSWPAGDKNTLIPDPSRIDPMHRKTLDALPPGPGPHFITGPVHVEGAKPGGVLQVDILQHSFPLDWGFVQILPLLGTLPDEFTEYETIHPTIDRERGVCIWPWGRELPLAPFFGIIAVSPPRAWGRYPSPPPRAFGGNMDNKELKPGASLYLPVFEEGALFWAGDGHGVQGDGEVCITALETALTGSFRLTVRNDLHFHHPFAETETHLISIGIDEDLDDAAKQAVRQMIDHVCRVSKLTRNQAYMLCSLAGDLRVTQTVDGNKGCHMMLAKAHI